MLRIMLLSALLCFSIGIHAQQKTDRKVMAAYEWRKDTALLGRDNEHYWDSIINKMVPYPLQDRAGETYRFVRLRQGADPVCIDLNRREHNIDLRLRVFESLSTTGQVKVIRDTTLTVTDAAWKVFRSKVEQAAFFKMEKEKRVFGCADGTIWNLESLASNADYHAVRRQCTVPEQFKNSCLYLLHLAHYDNKE